MSEFKPHQRPVDPRGMRFVASVTTVVLAAILVLGPTSGAAGVLLAVQTLVFASAAVLGLQAHPYGWAFRKFVRPRIGPPAEMEEPGPPRFAQGVGLGFALVAGVGFLPGLSIIFYVAAGMALAAAFLNAAFGFCLGCEVFLLLRQHTSFIPAKPQTEAAGIPADASAR